MSSSGWLRGGRWCWWGCRCWQGWAWPCGARFAVGEAQGVRVPWRCPPPWARACWPCIRWGTTPCARPPCWPLPACCAVSLSRRMASGRRAHPRGRTEHMQPDQNTRIAIIGLGYVGLPLAVEFGKHFDTVGYAIRSERVAELRSGKDSTLECSGEELAAATKLSYSDQLADIAGCNVYIVTVPTPIDAAKRPDLTPLVKASEAVGSVLKRGDVVVYESTVYPGCTEEDCVPILERVSGLK